MSRGMVAAIGILATMGLVLGCGGGGGGGGGGTAYDLNGTYTYSLVPGALTGNGASDCDPSEAKTGTVVVTCTSGTDQCQVVIDGTNTYTATANGNTLSYSESEPNYYSCDMYKELDAIRMTSANTASGSIAWTCSWTDQGTSYICAATDTLAITRK